MALGASVSQDRLSGPISIFVPVYGTARCHQVVNWVTGGRGSLKKVLGAPARRRRLFSRSLKKDQVIAATLDGKIVGYASYSVNGCAVLTPALKEFLTEYGLLRGLLGYAIFYAINDRVRSGLLYCSSLHVKPEANETASAEGSFMNSNHKRANAAAIALSFMSPAIIRQPYGSIAVWALICRRPFVWAC